MRHHAIRDKSAQYRQRSLHITWGGRKSVASIFSALIFTMQMAIAQPSNTNSAGSAANGNVDTINVQGQKEKPDQVIHNFIKSYAVPTSKAGKLARWSKRTALCPVALGLDPTFDVFISEHLRQIAAEVGAKPQQVVPCAPNLLVLISSDPQQLADLIAKEKSQLLGTHTAHQVYEITRITHPIQAWYATGTRDINGHLQDDEADNMRVAVSGSLIRDGLQSEILAVTVIVDARKLVGLQIGSVADYIAMLALSQTNAFDSCRPLPSVSNLFSADCEVYKSQSMTDADMAYLKGLYHMDADGSLAIQRDDIADQMKAAIASH